jgi:TonB family protein
MTDAWTKWEGRLVNGAFPLRRFLGNSDHSVVFLTEYRPLDISDAAIKLVPADPQLASGTLARWRTLRALSHPHLLRVFDSGHCQISGHPFFFIVMEYADQTLAQILPQRALTADEVRDLLLPALGALEFLHGRQLLQGQLKPENILVVGDQVKLASDTIRPIGDALPKDYRLSVYDAPELRSTSGSAAADIWGLGVTVVQALTQVAPQSTGGASDSLSLPASITQNFANTIRRCLNSDPALRPTLSDLRAALEPSREPERSVGAVSLPVVPFDARHLKHPAVIAVGAVLFLLLVWLGLRALAHHSDSTTQDAALNQSPASTASRQETQPQGSHAAANTSLAAPAVSNVLHQQLPSVSRSAQTSIRGHFKVSVRVNVDRTGNVTSAVLQDPGPSKYFGRVSVDAAKQWKFSPTDSGRVWLLEFAFSREKITAQASPKA